jgi:hypothetical protein
MTPILNYRSGWENPIAFHTEMMGDTMYLQQALRQPDAKEFVQAVIKEVNGHVDCNNWTLQKRSKVPEDVQITFRVATTTQTWSHNKQNQIIQGQIEPPRWKASLRNELFWDMHLLWHDLP